MTILKDFFSTCIKAQMRIAGDSIQVTSKGNGSKVTIQGILTERSGDITTEIGGSIYNLTAHLLTPVSNYDAISIGDKVKAPSGRTFIILTKVASPNDAGLSCDLTNY